MMKGFVKKSLVLLALAVLFAGCATGSEESSATSKQAGSMSGIPMKMDPAASKLTIGDGTGSVVAFLNGHTVEVADGASTAVACIDDGTGNSKCWVRLYNRDSDEYMANAFILFTACATCDGAPAGTYVMDNFDGENLKDPACWDANGVRAIDGCTAHKWSTTANLYTGGETPITGGGIALVTDTFIHEVPVMPYNPFGAYVRDMPGGALNVKPEWMIAPQCGYNSQPWDFGGSSTAAFGFWATVKAAYFKMNPYGTGDNGVYGDGDDDPRFDFENFSTVYVTVTDLVQGPVNAWNSAYRAGSVYRSNVLAGYKPDFATGTAGKSVADINYTGTGTYASSKRYFAVNVGVEAPDRLERMTYGVGTVVSTNGLGADIREAQFEYYNMIAIILTFNPKIIKETILAGGDSAWGLTKSIVNGGTRFQHKAMEMCHNGAGSPFVGACQNPDKQWGMDMLMDIGSTAVQSATPGDEGGYISTQSDNIVYMANAGWSYFTSGQAYSWWDGAAFQAVTFATSGNNRTIPRKWWGRGFTKIRCGSAQDTTCIQQDGPDADPEMWLFSAVMKVQPGAVGLGTEIKVDTFSSFVQYNMMNTFGTLDTRDYLAGSDVIDPFDPNTNAGPNQLSTGGATPSHGDGDWYGVWLKDGVYTTKSCTPAEAGSGMCFAGPGGLIDGYLASVAAGSTLICGGPNSGNAEENNLKIRHRGPAKLGTYQAWNVAVCIK